MKKLTKLALVLIFVFTLFTACSKPFMSEDGLYATFVTNQGDFTARIFFDKVPVTAGNFIGLSEGSIEFTDPATQVKEKKPYYNGIIFHRVIKDFMIQTGDPLGKGVGGPGYSFTDEFDSSLKHDTAGILSMANSGADTNGSQFFITLVPTPHLDNKHSVFGKIVDGMDIVNKIGVVPTDGSDKPYKDVFIKKINITRVGDAAKNFNALTAFESRYELAKKKDAEKQVVMDAFLQKLGCNAGSKIKTESGLEYYVLKEGSGKTPVKGSVLSVHYSGYFYDGKKFDSSYDRNAPFDVTIGVGQVIKGWDEALLTMKSGEKRVLVIPYYLGYGERGYSIIPPKATLIFETELLKIK
ncbi:MAG: hypothetical protein A2015_14140 [Spirochaetes bacterium GWF1_31_7]|nr:MAG: hypothetical protein A2Y30_03610 [Spirochaetes bacterium GWE1_32_154]OHD50542.1 MAG: hypothetical protein A2015_14140 [Spirochaetes bacterium GWF1_31_7]